MQSRRTVLVTARCPTTTARRAARTDTITRRPPNTTPPRPNTAPAPLGTRSTTPPRPETTRSIARLHPETRNTRAARRVITKSIVPHRVTIRNTARARLVIRNITARRLGTRNTAPRPRSILRRRRPNTETARNIPAPNTKMANTAVLVSTLFFTYRFTFMPFTILSSIPVFRQMNFIAYMRGYYYKGSHGCYGKVSSLPFTDSIMGNIWL